VRRRGDGRRRSPAAAARGRRIRCVLYTGPHTTASAW
jgi:hypothetical protein